MAANGASQSLVVSIAADPRGFRSHVNLQLKGFNTATVNGIRRAMLCELETLGFEELMDSADFRIVTKTVEEQRHTVLASTCAQPIPVLAHRLSRTPIYTSAETRKLLVSTGDRKVFFVICASTVAGGGPGAADITGDMHKQITKPYVGGSGSTGTLVVTIYARDLIPCVLVRDKIEEAEETAGAGASADIATSYSYSADESQAIMDMMETIFPYNVPLVSVSYGEKVNAILKPVLGRGHTDCRWSPCTFSYQYRMDPTWIQQGEELIEGGTNTLRRKIVGERSFKDLFTLDPATGKSYNLLGKPFGHRMAFYYNGKMSPVEALLESIAVLRNASDRYLAQYLAAQNGQESLISIDESSISSEDGAYNSQVELLYIPRNTQDKIPDEDLILTDHTMGNLLATKMLEIVSDRIEEMTSSASTQVELWKQTHIAYKVPHPLVKQCQLLVKLPIHLDISHEDLARQTTAAIKRDLETIEQAVRAAVEGALD